MNNIWYCNMFVITTYFGRFICFNGGKGLSLDLIQPCKVLFSYLFTFNLLFFSHKS